MSKDVLLEGVNKAAMQRTIFAVKLQELEQQYKKLLDHVRTCQDSSPQMLEEEILAMTRECQEKKTLLDQRVANSHTPAVSALSKAQLSYTLQVEKIWDNELKNLLGKSQIPEKQAETKLLYAEYSIDFAILSMQEAILASMSAISEEQKYEKWRNDDE